MERVEKVPACVAAGILISNSFFTTDIDEDMHRVLVKNLIKVAGTQDMTLPWFKVMYGESKTLKIKIPHLAYYYIRWFCNGLRME